MSIFGFKKIIVLPYTNIYKLIFCLIKMSEQKSMDVPYLEGIENVGGCLYYSRNCEDDSKIFSIREVMFCVYNGNCHHQSEKRYLFNNLFGTAVRQCKLGSTKSIEDMLGDTGMPLFTVASLSQPVEEGAGTKEGSGTTQEVNAAVTVTG